MTNDEQREELGKAVREEWIAWAKEQPNPKPSWLVQWEGLSEQDKEVDRRIGARLFNAGAMRVATVLDESGARRIDVSIAMACVVGKS